MYETSTFIALLGIKIQKTLEFKFILTSCKLKIYVIFKYIIW